MAAALVSAWAASTLPEPEPSRRPPRPYTVLAVSARVTWAGVRSGNCERMSATIPATIGEEKQANPFLRADVPEVAAGIGMAGKPAAEVFAEIRARKNKF